MSATEKSLNSRAGIGSDGGGQCGERAGGAGLSEHVTFAPN